MKNFWLTDYEPEVQIELFKVGQRLAMRSALSATALMIVILIMVWPHSSSLEKLIYAAICLLAIGLRLVSWRQFLAMAKGLGASAEGQPRRETEAPNQQWRKPLAMPWSAKLARRWQWQSALGMALQGSATGAVGLFFSEHALMNMLLICSYCATLSYALVANSSHDLPAFFMGLGFGGAVMSIFLPHAFHEAAIYLLPLNLFLLVLLCSAGVGSHRTFVYLVRLQISNANLAISNDLAAKRADRANQDKSYLLAAASHDLSQPVHALMMFVESLKQYRRDHRSETLPSGTGGEEDHLVNQIANASRVIGAMFNDLMELSRLESGVQVPQSSQVLLAPLILQCIETTRPDAALKAVQFRVRFSTACRTAAITTDRLMLIRAITNLLSNAIRYTERGKVLITLRAMPSLEGTGNALGRENLRAKMLVLSVYDTGVGIPPEHLKQIFEPYVQLNNAARERNKGLGMGLAIVDRCLRLLKLPVQVTSSLGKGSRFWIEMPHWENVSSTMLEAQEPDALHVASLQNRTVLLIDDDDMVREGLGSLMQAWKVDFKAFPRWDEAVKLALDQSGWCPDLVLCDYRLPGSIDGIALLGQMLAEYPTAIGLLQTGERPELVQPEADEAGYVVLLKPVAPFLLASTLGALLVSRSDRPGAT